MNTIQILDAAIKAVCPIHGVNSEMEISFKDEATPKQIQSAQAVLSEFISNTDSYENRAAIEQQITVLEAQITPRRLREAVLTGDTSFISSIDAQITALRATL